MLSELVRSIVSEPTTLIGLELSTSGLPLIAKPVTMIVSSWFSPDCSCATCCGAASWASAEAPKDNSAATATLDNRAPAAHVPFRLIKRFIQTPPQIHAGAITTHDG